MKDSKDLKESKEPKMAEGKTYTTLRKTGEDSFEEKRSLFIGAAAHVETEEEAMAFVKARKKQYADATHNVWAYSVKDGVSARYSDDGEPQGTAGMPTLDAIRKCGVDDAVVVVTRYFGGTLLGAGGLVRAYAKGAKIALEAAEIVTYSPHTVCRLTCSYADYKRLSQELTHEGALIDDTDFSDCVCITFAVLTHRGPSLFSRIRDLSGGKADLQVIGERFDAPRS